MRRQSHVRGIVLTAVAAGAFLLSGQAGAFDKFEMRVLGGFGNQPHIDDIEKPFFTKTLPQESGGKISVTYRTINEVGLKGFEAVRLLKLGIFDGLEMNFGYVGGDEPFVLGVDMVGAAADIPTLRKLVAAYRPHLEKLFEEKLGGKIMAIWPFPGQSIFCNAAISGLADLKGKKIRIYSPALSGLMKSFGAIGVTMAYPEVYPALQRGVLDCAITAAVPGNTAKWPEVTTHFYPINMSWAVQAHVLNLKFWNGLPADARKLLADGFTKHIEGPMWSLSETATQAGTDCNVGAASCKTYTKYNMKLVKVTPEDRKLLAQAVEKEVLPGWIGDCKKTFPDCAKVWNETGGKISGIMAK